MNFVVCSKEKYQKEYQAKHHMFPRLEAYEDLVGWNGIEVWFHEDFSPEDPDLEIRLQTLCDFKVITLVYIDEVGIRDSYFTKPFDQVKDNIGDSL